MMLQTLGNGFYRLVRDDDSYSADGPKIKGTRRSSVTFAWDGKDKVSVFKGSLMISSGEILARVQKQ